MPPDRRRIVSSFLRITLGTKVVLCGLDVAVDPSFSYGCTSNGRSMRRIESLSSLLVDLPWWVPPLSYCISLCVCSYLLIVYSGGKVISASDDLSLKFGLLDSPNAYLGKVALVPGATVGSRN